MAGANGRTAKLTKTAVDAASPKAKPYKVWDSDLKGFCLKVAPSGIKTYCVVYRPGGGGRASPKREFTIGRHGALTPTLARAEAERRLASVRLGANPQADRDKARADITVGALCDRYVLEGLGAKKPGTIRSDRSRIRCHIKPLLGTCPQASVTMSDVEKFLRDVADGKTAKREKLDKARAVSNVRGGKGAATRTVGLLGGIFTFAIKLGIRIDNPVIGVERFPDQESQRYLSDAELRRLGDALTAYIAAGGNPQPVAIIRLLLLTGCRLNEIAGLRWSEVDLQRSHLTLADSKTGAKTVPLGPPAVALLRELLAQRRNAPWVFASLRVEGSHYTGTAGAWKTITKAAELPGVRLHDLRHTFASVAIASGQTLAVLGQILGHKDVSTTAQYAHVGDNATRQGATTTANRTHELMGGTLDPAA